MSIETDLEAHLKTDGLLSGMVGDRVYRGQATPGAGYPYLTLFRVSTLFSPPLRGKDELPGPRVQLDAWSRDPDEADLLADRLESILADDFPGLLRGSLRYVQAAVVKDRASLREPTPHGGGVIVHRVYLDVRLWADE